MKGKNHRYIPNPREFAHEIAEETKVLCSEIAERITISAIPGGFKAQQPYKELKS